MGYFIGVDMGSTVIKSGLYTAEGKELAVSSCYNQLLSTEFGFSETDMCCLWRNVCKTIRQILNEASLSGNQIAGVGFSSHGKGLYAINRKGDPVRHGIVSSDTRAKKLIAELTTNHVDEFVYPRSLQPVWNSHPAVLLRWLKLNEPENYASIDKILMVHDYIRFRLTGEIAAELTNISSSNLFNQHTSAYDPLLMSAFSIDEVADKTAPIIASAQLAGRVSQQAATECSLAPGIAVYGGLFDVVGAALCSGVTDEQTLSAVTGTWSIATSVTEQVIEDNFPFAWGHYCITGKYFVHEGSPTSGGNLTWFLRQFFDNDQRCYAQFDKWVEERYCQISDIVFLPYLYGSNISAELSAGLTGLRGHHGMADIVYAIYLGIVFSHMLHQDRVLALNPKINRIRMTGGLARSAVWMQLFTDAGNLPVEVVQVQQSGCLAAALCAAVGAGEYQGFTEALQAVQPALSVYMPNESSHSRLREQMAHYLDVATALSSIKN